MNQSIQNSNTGIKRLSCTNCRQRKVRCNKSIPCRHCQVSGQQCVYPKRAKNLLPKQDSIPDNAELLARVNHLESLVSNIYKPSAAVELPKETFDKISNSSHTESAKSYGARSGSDTHKDSFDHPTRTVVDDLEVRHYSDPLWSSLSDEIGGLRKLLEDATLSEDVDEDDADDATLTQHPGYSPNFPFDSDSNFFELNHPPESQRAVLFRYYYSNVHPLCKVLHWPSIITWLEGSSCFADEDTSSKGYSGRTAIAFVIYFASVTSMSSIDCQKYFNEEKIDLVARYRRSAEAAISYADFLSSTEIAPLQAFVLYLMVMRSYDTTQASWTFVGLAVRIAHGLDLHQDGNGRRRKPFEAEMRRRLWWQIVILDTRACEDRGSEPMILDGSYTTIMPTNLNDEDFNIQSQDLPPARTGITEMAFCLISMDVSNTSSKLNFIHPFQERRLLQVGQREEAVKACVERINSIYIAGANPLNSSTWLPCTIGRFLVLRLWLSLQYPMQCVNSPSQDFAGRESLRTAVEYLNLSQQMRQDELATGFLWLFRTYVPWQPVAVILAEICREPQGALVDEAWSIILNEFEKWGEQMAAAKRDRVWRAVKNLMAKARAAREKKDQRFVEPQNLSLKPIEPGDIIDLSLSDSNFGAAQDNAYSQVFCSDSTLTIPTTNLSFELHSGDTTSGSMHYTNEFDSSLHWDHWNDFVLDAAADGGDFDLNQQDAWMI